MQIQPQKLVQITSSSYELQKKNKNFFLPQ